MAFFLSLLIQISVAQTFYMGGQAGFSDASGPFAAQEAAFSYGGRLGWIFYDHVAFGAMAQFHQLNSITSSIGYFPLLAEVTFYPYHSPLEHTSLFVSALFGTTKVVFDLGQLEGTNTQTTFGFGAGYGVFIDPRFFVGPEFQYLLIFDNETYAIWSASLALRLFF